MKYLFLYDETGPISAIRTNLTEFLDILEKNGFRRDGKTDLPSTKAREAQVLSLSFPTTLQGIRNLPFAAYTVHLGKAVSQLPNEGYATSEIYPILLQHLAELVLAYDNIRQELLKLPSDLPRRLDEVAAGQK